MVLSAKEFRASIGGRHQVQLISSAALVYQTIPPVAQVIESAVCSNLAAYEVRKVRVEPALRVAPKLHKLHNAEQRVSICEAMRGLK